jgi:SAM-dependent methyltransferase
MIWIPLVDYDRSTTQLNRARAAAKAARAQSSHPGNSRDHKNGGTPSSIPRTVGSTSLTTGTHDIATEPPAFSHPFTERHGRRYLRDPTLPYPLPCDLSEIHRQTLRTILLCQVFNGPVCSPAFETKPPNRVLEVGCGSGIWSVMCYRHFARRGFTSIAFTGLDIAPLAPRMDPDDDMNWRFVQHDLRRLPLPFQDEEFDLIMTKDLSMVTPETVLQQQVMDEYLRILRPRGSLEIWDGDHCLRMLLPHTPPVTNDSDGNSEHKEQAHINATGTYTLTTQTPLAAAQNQYIQDYNGWMSKVIESRKLTQTPCTQIRPFLLQQSEILTDPGCQRVAIPLGEVLWEHEGFGGASAHGTNGIGTAVSKKGKEKSREPDRRALTSWQAALRRTALNTFVQMIESLEPLLREVSGKDPKEWDRWQEGLMNDLFNNNGTSRGECLEVCAGWARKKKAAVKTPN